MDLFDWFQNKPSSKQPEVELSNGDIHPVLYKKNARAKRYILRVDLEGNVVVTVPRYGTQNEALDFARSKADWIEAQLSEDRRLPEPAAWQVGSMILFRGVEVPLEGIGPDPHHSIQLGDLIIPCPRKGWPENLRPTIEAAMAKKAAQELFSRTEELAKLHGYRINRIVVKNQKTRWGSCSIKRNINLNWRLIQTPAFVMDYIILHELSHLKHMNHSTRFWAEVERVCPDYRKAEAWLKSHSGMLRE